MKDRIIYNASPQSLNRIIPDHEVCGWMPDGILANRIPLLDIFNHCFICCITEQDYYSSDIPWLLNSEELFEFIT